MLIVFLNVFKDRTGRGMGNLNHFGDIFNPLHASVLFLYSLKTSEKLLLFSGGIKMEYWREMV